MLRNKYILFSLLALFLLGGCATAEKKSDDYEKQTLRKRVSFLENKVADLTNLLEKQKGNKQGQKISKESRGYYFFVIKIQTALRNAGFNPGLIDGRMGSRTRLVLKEFQKANGLPMSGRVDKQTWELLRKYL